ncbi:four-carbon acid sugar kinase family protein [Novosphingobium sp. YJ-S2-02]|uniref:3-oxo-tetronate kinase n=1 Tax=Novosphingobium aureum TaxID=2792964 RepID=A0A931MLF5_9SPHN|nr:3-oxo-tetronate kinase [Novosphingobium aureum]MBH0113858.1 four-carbon acid sugar kinase family protein [Novosphingobium aureum]
MPLLLGCIADDLTGATDLANELARAGLRTFVQVGADPEEPDERAQAIVVALKSRSVAASEAIGLSLTALAGLKRLGAEHIYFKYCSTFDSTAQGNIGPVLEALTEATGAELSLACPAFPANRRTVYQGHLFVGTRLLEHSGMEHHPLNPMTRSDLVALLQEQMRGRVGLLAHDDVDEARIVGALAGLQAQGTKVAIADAVDDRQLDLLGAQCASMQLSSGASGLGAGIARHLAAGQEAVAQAMPVLTGRRLVLAGSCSSRTLEQLAHARAVMPSFSLADHLEAGDAAIVAQAVEWFERQPPDRPALIYASAQPREVEMLRERFGSQVGARLESLLGAIARAANATGCDRLIVAGGESSGAVVAALGIVDLAIGPQIAAGVPWTIARRAGGERLALALKSGNFGDTAFLTDAWEALPCPATT